MFMYIRHNSETIGTIDSKFWYIKFIVIMNILCLIIFFSKINSYWEMNLSKASALVRTSVKVYKVSV